MLGNLFKVGFLAFDLSDKGFKNFFDLYSSSIKIAGALIIVITLIMTLERMKQTKEQVDIISDNNKFNNFYKHQEQFVKYFLNNNLVLYLTVGDHYEREKLINKLYEIFYYSSYTNFTPSINLEAKAKVNLFISKITQYKLNEKQTELMKIEGINELYDSLKPIFQTIFSITEPRVLNEISKRKRGNQKFKNLSRDDIERYEAIMNIYYLANCIDYILNFQGITNYFYKEFKHKVFLLALRYGKHF